MNKFIIMGRITRDLELKTTANGTAVCQFCVAVDRNYQLRRRQSKHSSVMNRTTIHFKKFGGT